MSGLATFVAAALRDKSTQDLLEENQELQRRLDLAPTWNVRIQSAAMGEGDEVVVFATGQLKVRELLLSLIHI